MTYSYKRGRGNEGGKKEGWIRGVKFHTKLMYKQPISVKNSNFVSTFLKNENSGGFRIKLSLMKNNVTPYIDLNWLKSLNTASF